jgi:hypothetical protein
MMDDRTISERLIALGVTHTSGTDQRRALSCLGIPIGMATAEEAVNLLNMLDTVSGHAMVSHQQGESK